MPAANIPDEGHDGPDITTIQSSGVPALAGGSAIPDASARLIDHAPSHEAECLEARAAVCVLLHADRNAEKGECNHG